MENTPVTQEIFAAFMKCLNQYDFSSSFNFGENEKNEMEVDENQLTKGYLSEIEQLRLI